MNKTCPVCNQVFEASRQKVYCSSPCYWRYFNAKRSAYRKTYWKRENALQVAKVSGKAWRDRNRLRLNEAARLRYLVIRDAQREARSTPAYRAKAAQRMREKLAANPLFKLQSAVSGAVRRGLRNFSDESGVFGHLGYTLVDLKLHLERYFNPANGFTWNNYGSVWHVDHVVPKSWFDVKRLGDSQFKACWCLQNLRPALKAKNLSKLNRYAADLSRSMEAAQGIPSL